MLQFPSSVLKWTDWGQASKPRSSWEAPNLGIPESAADAAASPREPEEPEEPERPDDASETSEDPDSFCRNIRNIRNIRNHEHIPQITVDAEQRQPIICLFLWFNRQHVCFRFANLRMWFAHRLAGLPILYSSWFLDSTEWDEFQTGSFLHCIPRREVALLLRVVHTKTQTQ